MKVYGLSRDTIEQCQWRDPLLRHVTDKILRLVDGASGRALDVGCGVGRVAIALAGRGFQVDAVDIEPKIVDQARELAVRAGVKVQFSIADFSVPDLRFPEGLYDLVVCSEVLEHIGPWPQVIDNIARVLKSEGLLLLTTPNDPRQFSILDEYAGHLRRFSWPELTSALASFEILEAFTVGFPLTRAIHWAYTRLALPLAYKKHSPEKMWRPGSFYERFGAQTLYRLVQVDDLFNSLKRGTTWVVKAKKSSRISRMDPTPRGKTLMK